MIMKNLIFILAMCISSFAFANESSGSAAAKEWLKVVDAGNYAESWQKSDSFLQSEISQSEWDTVLTGVRTPLGKVNSRSELEVKEYEVLPGVPDGEYLVIQFQTDFQNKGSATETLVLSKGSGQWLLVGYYIN
jgi:opacity protein-like surface antigen